MHRCGGFSAVQIEKAIAKAPYGLSARRVVVLLVGIRGDTAPT